MLLTWFSSSVSPSMACVRPLAVLRSLSPTGVRHATKLRCDGLRLISTTRPVFRGSKNLDWYFNALREDELKRQAVEAPVFPPEPLHGRKRVRAFIDFQFGRDASTAADAGATSQPGGEKQGDSSDASSVHRVVVELADDLVPLTVRNFLELCERPRGEGYRGSAVMQVRRGFGVLLGDWRAGNGTGGASAFAPRYFADENFCVRHSAPGVLTMANAGVHANSSVFFITLAKAPQLDGRNVAFGRVIAGMDVIRTIGASFAVNLTPANPIRIQRAGLLPADEWAAIDKAVLAEQKSAATAASKPSTKSAGRG